MADSSHHLLSSYHVLDIIPGASHVLIVTVAPPRGYYYSPLQRGNWETTASQNIVKDSTFYVEIGPKDDYLLHNVFTFFLYSFILGNLLFLEN